MDRQVKEGRSDKEEAKRGESSVGCPANTITKTFPIAGFIIGVSAYFLH